MLYNDSAKHDILAWGRGDGAYDSQIRIQATFLYNAPSHQVLLSYV